jgi:hypothetical protein
VDAKASLAASGDVGAVRDLVHPIFQSFGWIDATKTQDVEDRIARSESQYRSGLQPGITAENIAKAINNAAVDLHAPEYAKTDVSQVRYLRFSLMMGAPHLVGGDHLSSTTDGQQRVFPETMSPAEAVYVSLSLIHQKLYNPKYQATASEWAQARAAENWQKWKDARSGKTQAPINHPTLVSSSNSPRTAEMRNFVTAAAARLNSNAARSRIEKGLDDLGCRDEKGALHYHSGSLYDAVDGR